MPKVSVIIVNYNAGPLLSETVNFLLKSALVTRVIVVDNASGDDSMQNVERIAASHPSVVCIRNHKNLGFAKACNIGMAADGESDYLLFLNPDCLIENQALGKLLRCMQTSPEIGMAGPLLLNVDGTEQASCRRRIPTPWIALVRALGLSKFNKILPGLFSDFLLHKMPLPEVSAEVEAISGACMLIRRAALEDAGSFDPGYFLHCEDLDLCARFQQKGWKIIFVPEARAVHYKRVCSRTTPIFVEWHKHRGMIRFYKKFYRKNYPELLFWIVQAGVFLRFCKTAAVYGVCRVGQRVIHDGL